VLALSHMDSATSQADQEEIRGGSRKLSASGLAEAPFAAVRPLEFPLVSGR